MKAALVGNGIGKSLTPGMHEAEGRALGLDYTYERIETGAAPWQNKPLAEILDLAEAEGYAGLNITHPHKIAAVAYLDHLSGAARTLGAVNTIVFQDGRRIGHTTDYSGFGEALRVCGLPARGARIVQFGAGGAGSATALALVDAGAHLTLIDRDTARAKALAEQLRSARPEAEVSSRPIDLAGVDGAVNATPIGMDAYPGMAFDPEVLHPDAWVADIVYFPLETALTRAARAHGLRVMNGRAMALHQAVAAFEIITGVKPDAERMGDSFDRLLPNRSGHVSESA